MYLDWVSGLSKPARYYPWTKGVYDVAPGLRPFGTDFGNNAADQNLFQLDSDRVRYRRNKRDALCERRDKYVQEDGLSSDVSLAACKLISHRLSAEYPERFQLNDGRGGLTLTAEGGRIFLEPEPHVLGIDSAPPIERLALILQEDIALVCAENGRDRIAYLHLCSPSHWRAEDKIGKSFFAVHEPIPGFERVNAVASNLVDSMIRRGPFVRFVWGVESDYRLNHHPDPPPGWDHEEWQGRDFSSGSFWVRTERQIVWGMPEVNAALFVIRVGFVSSEEILASKMLRESLKSSLESMSDEAREYKGLARDWKNLMTIVGE